MPLPPLPPLLPAVAAAMTDGASSPSSSVSPSRRGDAAVVGTAVLPVPSTSTRPAGSERGYKPDAPGGSRIQRQDWSRLHVDGPQLDGWYITKIVLRSISCILMLTMIAMYLVIIVPQQTLISYNMYYNRLNAPLVSGMHAVFGVFAFATLSWDLTEFVTMCCRRGYGITPKAHIGIELTLFFWGAGAVSLVAILGVVPVWYSRYFSPPNSFGVEEVTSVAVIGGIIVIIRFILFVRNAVDRCGGRGLTPRIMYLQTGEPVVVMRRPYPPPPTMQEPDIEMGDRTTAQPAAGAATLSAASTLVASPPRTSFWGVIGRKLKSNKAPLVAPTVPSSSPQPTSPVAPESAVASSPQQQPQEQIHQESEQPQPQAQQQRQHTRSPPTSPQQIPRRRPVPTRGADSERSESYGPTPAYEPDEAERRRAERGEAQAQWMTLEDMGVRGPASGKRRGEAGDNADRQAVDGRGLEDGR
ncbi:hypothetical protein GGTG_10882 [Gaeumannomyces tritici R3-111a-1]|uniref:Uncharacterized protein n=1 Tax=Gaeumannomyces tritici (strain R3-111a-1) TaxID=644352 RepID=J3PBL0_GAET3|nr:hypothetical protein GGTG_10882 [Gaeumannomyces tritici R3-111a-1]EJT71627.1 hypothetical protein GGTG_10882 [Gaeumannomyces tritici R3-111a-1]